MMAKTNTVAAATATESKALAAAVSTALATTGASHAVDASEAVAVTEPVQGPTPENTPVPGGGRWRWDISKPGWVDLDAVPESTPTTD